MRLLLFVLLVALSIAAASIDSTGTSRAGSELMLLASECEPGPHDDCSGSADNDDDEDESDEDEEESEEESSDEERAIA